MFGFSNLSPATRRQIGLPEFSRRGLAQLLRLFGEQATSPVEVLVKDWSDDEFTATQADHAPLTSHPMYGLTPAERALWEGRILLAGSESAEQNGGYLEGALEAATDVLKWLADSQCAG